MAMYYYASKISAIACGTRCKKSVLQKSRGQRDRDKYSIESKNKPVTINTANTVTTNASETTIDTNINSNANTNTDDDETDDTDGLCMRRIRQNRNGNNDGHIYVNNKNDGIGTTETSVSTLFSVTGDSAGVDGGGGGGAGGSMASNSDGLRCRRRFSEQLDNYENGFQNSEVSNRTASTITKNNISSYLSNINDYNYYDNNDIIQYDVPKNTYKCSQTDINFESSVLGSNGIMYINGKIISGPLDSLINVLIPDNINDLDKEFIFSFLLSSRLYLRPHELFGKLLSMVPDCDKSLESLVAFLAEWTNKFPYDYRDERMMNHVKHIVARCSRTCLEVTVSDILSALLNRLTDLESHEKELRSCQTVSSSCNNSKISDKPEFNMLDCSTSTQYGQILCRIEKKLAKHIGPEEFVQCNNNILLDKQKKWDQPGSVCGPPGVQDPKKTCNLETYLEWSARLRLFICNEILHCSGIRDRSKTVELWTGVAQYCLLVGNYNSATTILETLESPAIARLKITWSQLQVTCQQLDCMQRHAEGHGNLWHKQTINQKHQHQHQQYHDHHHPPHHHHHHHNDYQEQQQHQQQQRHENLSAQPTADMQFFNNTSPSKAVMLPTSLSLSSSTATTVTALTDASVITTTDIIEAETMMMRGLRTNSQINSIQSCDTMAMVMPLDSTATATSLPMPIQQTMQTLTQANQASYVPVTELLGKQEAKIDVPASSSTSPSPSSSSSLLTEFTSTITAVTEAATTTAIAAATITPAITIESLLKAHDNKETTAVTSDKKCLTKNSIMPWQLQQQEHQASSSMQPTAIATNSSVYMIGQTTAPATTSNIVIATTMTPTTATVLLLSNLSQTTAPKTSPLNLMTPAKSSNTIATIVASVEAAAAVAVATTALTSTIAATTTIATTPTIAKIKLKKPNDWVVIPVFADIVKLALTGRENCLQRLPNGHINMSAFDRMAAIVGAFTKHMQAVKCTLASPINGGEYEMFCRHMQKITKLGENDLMMASFNCEEPNNAEKLMYDLN